MTITYKLNKDLVARAATQLNWDLSQLKSSISIIGERNVNGKSLIGILSGGFKKDDNIQIIYDEETEIQKIKDCFNEIGEEIHR